MLFRNDLRVEDHEALAQAQQSGTAVVGLYVFEKYLFTQTTQYGFKKTGAYRAKFLLESVQDLQDKLASLNIPLFIRFGITDVVLSELNQELCNHAYEINNVFYSIEHTDEELEVIELAQEAHPAWNWQSSWTKGLYSTSNYKSMVDVPDSFTPFRKYVEQHFIVPEPRSQIWIADDKQLQVFEVWKSLSDWHRLPCWETLGLSEPEFDRRQCIYLKGGSTAGFQRLNYYLFDTNAIATYKETRNGLLQFDDSSKLSAWLANGSISAKQIYSAITKYEQERVSNESTYWLKFELLWREFFLMMSFKHGYRLFMQSGVRKRHKKWSIDDQQMQQWKNGCTGFELVDASMKELAATGFTSNRARQNAASLLVQTWGIDWLFGAEWYESMLIDYDPAVNYGNWQYLAGVGHDPRGDRAFNIEKQTQQYDPQRKFIRHWK